MDKGFFGNIFGFQKGTHRVGSLVDSKSEQEFGGKLEQLKLGSLLNRQMTK